MIIADSSYIVEGLLKNKKLLSDDKIVTPELVLYEVANSLWKHEQLLKDIENGKPYLSILYGLIFAGKITVLSPNENQMNQAYTLAKRNDVTLYDAIFVSMAIELGLELKTFDKAQTRAFESEKKKVSK